MKPLFGVMMLVIMTNKDVKYLWKEYKELTCIYNIIRMTSRIGNRWTVNECLQLQREYELLELSIDEIAARHSRTPNAIMFKLDQEGFADYNTLYHKFMQVPATFQIPMEPPFQMEPENTTASYDSNEDLRKQIKRMKKQISALTKMFAQQNTTTPSSSSMNAYC